MKDFERHDSQVEDIDTKRAESGTRCDPHGYPLLPQPSSSPLDPLNWPYGLKIFVLLQVSFLAMLGPFNSSIINSAFVPLAKSLNITPVQASYNTTISIVFAGVAPLFWIPLAKRYGRRWVYLCTGVVGVASAAGSAVSTNWAGLMTARAFNGIGTSAGILSLKLSSG